MPNNHKGKVHTQLQTRQFVISTQKISNYELNCYDNLLGLHIYRATNLPLIPVKSINGETNAICLGWVVYNGRLYNSVEEINLAEGDSLDNFIFSSSGRYICLFTDKCGIYLKTDAGGLLSTVYSLEHQIIASTPSLIADLYGQKLNYELNAIINIPKFFGWYPFGLTPFVGITRLIPNHHIKINNWSIHRTHLPLKVNNDHTLGNEMTAKLIAKLTQANVGAIIGNKKGLGHLTAGYDSRMVLAACRKFIKKCKFVTITNTDQGTKLDCFVAGQLAQQNNFDHDLIPFKQSTEKQIEGWLDRVDHCVYDNVAHLTATVKKTDVGIHVITGTCGEVGRAYYWLEGDLYETGLSPEQLISRLGFPNSKIFYNEAKQWLEAVPSRERTKILDLAYIEQRLGCWGGPSVYGHDIDFPTLSPFNSHEIFDLMLSLSKEYRFKGGFFVDFIEYLWPNLLKIPINCVNGINSLRFPMATLKRMLPKSLFIWLKFFYKRLVLNRKIMKN